TVSEDYTSTTETDGEEYEEDKNEQ
ncbi:jg4823, partial [Pararge aegeria aegeria]